jgi:hypothetical protein
VEKVKRFALLGEDRLPDSEELTPTMKLKHRGVLARYAEVTSRLTLRSAPFDRPPLLSIVLRAPPDLGKRHVTRR